MIEVKTNYSIDEVLEHPEKFIDESQDIVLVKIYGKDINNPTMIMAGKDDKTGEFYFVVEDNDSTEDIYCKDRPMTEVFSEIIKEHAQ